jgi:antirestriction protein
MTNQTGEIRIYVACLAAYNAGRLHGAWIDAVQSEEYIRQDIADMLELSPQKGAEEYAIHDYEGFEGARLEEYSSIETVCALAEFIGEHGALGGKLVEYFGGLDDARQAIADHYAGVFRSLADFAADITEQTTEIPESLEYYIDYEKMARDMEVNDVLSIETGFDEVHVFWRC